MRKRVSSEHRLKLSDGTVYIHNPGDEEHLKFVTDHANRNKLGLVNETTGEEIIKLQESKKSDKK